MTFGQASQEEVETFSGYLHLIRTRTNIRSRTQLGFGLGLLSHPALYTYVLGQAEDEAMRRY